MESVPRMQFDFPYPLLMGSSDTFDNLELSRKIREAAAMIQVTEIRCGQCQHLLGYRCGWYRETGGALCLFCIKIGSKLSDGRAVSKKGGD